MHASGDRKANDKLRRYYFKDTRLHSLIRCGMLFHAGRSV